ncbi:MAG TPA: hypothetical protein VKZ74_07295 [Natronosporangium sp.]|nr:hypothetical protein [Natronosporangium sp.]
MSHQGPPGGGYPERPYDPPSDPWGGTQEDAWRDPLAPSGGYRELPPYYRDGDHQGGGYRGGGYHEAGYGRRDPAGGPTAAYGACSYQSAEPGVAPRAADRRDRRGGALLFVAVGVLVLVIAAAVGYALYLLSGDGDATADGGGPATAPASAVPTGTAEPSPGQDNIGLNAATAREGDCLTNLGTDVEPQLQVVACDDEDLDGPVYQVLEKFEVSVAGANREEQDASAQETCGDVEGYTHHYFEVSPTLSFVLCMEQQ